MKKVSSSRLKKLREESKLKKDEFAKLFGVSESTQTSYENGNRDVPINYAIEVCDYCGVTLDWLCDRSENRNAIDMQASIVLALDKIIKIYHRTIKRGDEVYADAVILVDKIFAKYLKEIEELKKLQTINEYEAILQVRCEMQKKYKEYFRKLFEANNYETADIDYNKYIKIEDIEIIELIADMYYKD